MNFPAMASFMFALKPKFLRHLNSCKVRARPSDDELFRVEGDAGGTRVYTEGLRCVHRLLCWSFLGDERTSVV